MSIILLNLRTLSTFLFRSVLLTEGAPTAAAAHGGAAGIVPWPWVGVLGAASEIDGSSRLGNSD